MDLSAVIVNWNSHAYLARLAASLVPLRGELKEVVVVDNASDDSSLQALQNYPDIELLRLDRNRGFAAAANEGISQTSAPFILLLNPDVEIVSDSVRRLYERILKQPGAAIVCGPLVDSRGVPQSFQIRPFPTFVSALRDVLFLDEMIAGWGGNSAARPGHGVTPSAEATGVEIEQPAAAFWVLRKSAWEAVGGFDAQFFPAWFEDVDFCRRLRAQGWCFLYFPDSPVVHRGGQSLERLGYRAFIQIYYKNLLRYFRKHHPYSYPLLWFPVKCGIWARKRLVTR